MKIDEESCGLFVNIYLLRFDYQIKLLITSSSFTIHEVLAYLYQALVTVLDSKIVINVFESFHHFSIYFHELVLHNQRQIFLLHFTLIVDKQFHYLSRHPSRQFAN